MSMKKSKVVKQSIIQHDLFTSLYIQYIQYNTSANSFNNFQIRKKTMVHKLCIADFFPISPPRHYLLNILFKETLPCLHNVIMVQQPKPLLAVCVPFLGEMMKCACTFVIDVRVFIFKIFVGNKLKTTSNAIQ